MEAHEHEKEKQINSDKALLGWMKCKTLYELKDLVIKSLNVHPIGYHRFGKHSFALYELAGFTFHSPISDVRNLEYLGYIVPYSISSENTTNEPLTVLEALKIIDEFLGSDFAERANIKG